MKINCLSVYQLRSLLSVAALALVLFVSSCGDDDSGGDNPPDEGTRIIVTVTTSGVEPDTDGYTVSLSTGATMNVPSDGSVTFEDVPAGVLVDVILEGARVNCDPEEGFEQSFFMVEDATENVSFTMECTTKPLVFSSNRDGEYNIYRMNLDGSGIRRIVGMGEGARWSPDGTKIAYWGFDDAIHIIDPDGSNNTIAIENADSPADWSPDGTQLALEINNQIHIVNVDGSGLTQVTDLPGEVFYVDWGPEADPRLLFSYKSDDDVDEGIFIVNTDGTNLIELTNDYDEYASWSNAGDRISFSRYDMNSGTFAIYTMELPDGEPVLRSGIGTSEVVSRWSPDDSELTFVTILTDILGNYNAEVCTGSSTQPGAINLTQNLADDYDSDWRPE